MNGLLDHAVGFLLPAAAALVIVLAAALCICANRKRKAVLRSDIPTEINGIQTISRKTGRNHDSDRFRSIISVHNGATYSQNRRLPERPVSLIDPSAAASPPPSSPSQFLSLPSTSNPTLHRQLPQPELNLSADARSSTSKKRKAPDNPDAEPGNGAFGDDRVGRDDGDEDEDEFEDRPYAKVKVATKKAKKKQRDHPYAKIKDGPSGAMAELESDSDDDDQGSSDENHQVARMLSPQQRSAGSLNDVPSTSARTGSTVEMPFPSPPGAFRPNDPELRPLSVANASNPSLDNISAQPHFSGDSGDSRGYTSISVREPLAHIRAQMALAAASRPVNLNVQESPYASVIEDSDEMYAAIDSETYAQIELPSLNDDSINPPQPPSVRSLRSAVQSSQARFRISSPPVLGAGVDVIDGYGEQHSPLPERRVLNSPLPPTPTPPAERREDLYATVTGKSRPSTTIGASTSTSVLRSSPRAHKRIKSETLSMHPSNSHPLPAGASPSMSSIARSKVNEVNYSDFEVVRDGLVPLQVQHSRRPRSSAMLPLSSESDIDPNYETIKNHGPLPTPPVPGSKVVVPSGDVYAQIQVSQKRSRLPACPPPLPVVRDPSPEPSDTYATINLRDDERDVIDDLDEDPNYERLAPDPRQPADFGYESVKDDGGNDDLAGSRRSRLESDYESLGYNRIRQSPGEPGYEEIVVPSGPQNDDDENYEKVMEPTSARDDAATELYDDGYEQLNLTSENNLPERDVYAVVNTKTKTASTSKRSEEEKVLCRLMELPPIERARKVENKPRVKDPESTATNMTVVTINDDEISIRNHLKEELPPLPSQRSAPVQLVVHHPPTIFEDVTLQL